MLYVVVAAALMVTLAYVLVFKTRRPRHGWAGMLLVLAGVTLDGGLVLLVPEPVWYHAGAFLVGMALALWGVAYLVTPFMDKRASRKNIT